MSWLATNTLVIVVESDPKTQDSKGRYLRRYIRSQLMRVLREDRLGTRRPPVPLDTWKPRLLSVCSTLSLPNNFSLASPPSQIFWLLLFRTSSLHLTGVCIPNSLHRLGPLANWPPSYAFPMYIGKHIQRVMIFFCLGIPLLELPHYEKVRNLSPPGRISSKTPLKLELPSTAVPTVLPLVTLRISPHSSFCSTLHLYVSSGPDNHISRQVSEALVLVVYDPPFARLNFPT